MNTEQAKGITKWVTKLKPIKKDADFNTQEFLIQINPTWIVTDFARNMRNDFLYVVQPLVDPSGMGVGVSGMTVFCLTEEELMQYFEIQ